MKLKRHREPEANPLCVDLFEREPGKSYAPDAVPAAIFDAPADPVPCQTMQVRVGNRRERRAGKAVMRRALKKHK